MVTTFYSWPFGVLEQELEFCNLFLIIVKQRGGGSEILAPKDVKFYWLSTYISFVKIRILRFAVERHKVRHVMFIQGTVLASMKKPHAGEVWKKYIICRIICELK